MTRVLLLLSIPLAVATACSSPGTVEFTGDVPAMGSVRTVLYEPSLTETEPLLIVTSEGLYDVSPSPSGVYQRSHNLTLFREGITCSQLEREEERRADAVFDLLNASNDGDDIEALCAAIPDYFRASDWGAPASLVGFTWCEQDTEACGSIGVGSIDAASGRYVAVDSGAEPWGERMAESWNESSCEPGLGADEGSTRYEAGEVAILVDSVDPGDRISGSFTAELTTEGGASAGAVAGEFDAEWCEVPASAPILIF